MQKERPFIQRSFFLHKNLNFDQSIIYSDTTINFARRVINEKSKKTSFCLYVTW